MGLKPLCSLNRHHCHEYHAATRGFCSLGGDGMVTVLSGQTRPAGASLQTGIKKQKKGGLSSMMIVQLLRKLWAEE